MMKTTFQNRSGFTLIELLVVIAIMGFMGAMSVASYRSMRRGMEEDTVLKNASQFIRLAYQRSQIDRNPVNVYFWNETLQVETDDTELKVIGRAAAVRRQGRLTRVNGKKLVDEFSDLQIDRYKNTEGEFVEGNTDYQQDAGRYMYQVNGNESAFARSSVSQLTTADTSGGELQFLSYPANYPNDGDNPNEQGKTLTEYAYYMRSEGGIQWKVGDAYGFEFAELDLPSGYLFGSSYSKSADGNNIAQQGVFNFNPSGTDGGGQTIQISNLRPNASGVLTPVTIGSTVSPSSKQDQQNK